MDNTGLFYLIFNLHGQSGVADNLMSFGATNFIYLLFLLVFILGIKGGTKEKKALILILVSLPIAIFLIKIIHIFFYEPRPFVAFHFSSLVPETPNASFPSRHATIAAILAFSYTYLKSKWAIFFLLTMIWIGIGRVYVGVHYPLDILGGFVIAIFSIVIGLTCLRSLRTYLHF